MMRKMRLGLGVSLLLAMFTATTTLANVSLPSVFGHHMVLQQNKPIKIWGKAQPRENITVVFAGKGGKTEADINGNWSVTLPALKANATGRTMTITANNTIVLHDILVGEVWVCSGQSNMEWPLANANNKDAEIAAADFPNIRLFKVAKNTSPEPLDDCNASWKVCTPENTRGFSAVGYFFGRNLHKHLNVPVGLIGTYWGGTVAETWTSQQALLEKMDDFDDTIAKMQEINKDHDGKMAKYRKEQAEYALSKEKVFKLEDDDKTALQWADPSLDTSDWKPMQCPTLWENAGYPKMDGILWYRKTIDIPEDWAGKKLLLLPGPIDEVDQTFFNGTYVDGKGDSGKNQVEYWNIARKYIVPGHLVKAGKNTIAIRVFDLAGGGGLNGQQASQMVATLANGTTDQVISLAGEWLTKAEFTVIDKPHNPFSPNRPGILFNTMLNPVIGYGIKGAIWYQGESNASRAAQYRTLLPTMIGDWRDRWDNGPFPFLIVSLANYRLQKPNPDKSSWAELREAQLMTAQNDPQTGLAMAIDIGEARDIHPRNKQDVGYRLFLQAREIAYGEKLVAQGPLFKSVKFSGKQATLTFDNVGSGLTVKGDTLKGFEVQGADGKTVWADAVIKGKTIVVSAEGVSDIKAVRYGWADNPDVNLYNKEGLPAVPFRTDVP
ncbi:MAG: 9-O-acetylesterase [Phycisphaeraceae bacterium]|nr:9-O-acetylesterase [Phycisphaeraceae bacterium]